MCVCVCTWLGTIKAPVVHLCICSCFYFMTFFFWLFFSLFSLFSTNKTFCLFLSQSLWLCSWLTVPANIIMTKHPAGEYIDAESTALNNIWTMHMDRKIHISDEKKEWVTTMLQLPNWQCREVKLIQLLAEGAHYLFYSLNCRLTAWPLRPGNHWAEWMNLSETQRPGR